MFIFSFKASKVKLFCLLGVCALVIVAILSFLPNVGSSLNVNKIDVSADLNKIDVKSEKGRMEYLASLGYTVKSENVSEKSEKLPKVFDAVTEKYNSLQRTQGFDLAKYSGKTLKGYTYEVTSLPDSTKLSDDKYLATLIVYKNKVVGADLCCPERGKCYPLISLS